MPRPKKSDHPDQLGIPLPRERMDWALRASLLHFSTGDMRVLFTKEKHDPFQIISWYIGSIPAAVLVNAGKIQTFKMALDMVYHSPEIGEALRLNDFRRDGV